MAYAERIQINYATPERKSYQLKVDNVNSEVDKEKILAYSKGLMNLTQNSYSYTTKQTVLDE